MSFAKSFSFDEQELIQWILQLHCKFPIELDPTYSKGNFYKGNFPEPVHKFDLYPQVPGVLQANAEDIPLVSDSINTIMFDPPFLATTGKSLLADDDSNKINKRFSVFPNEKALHQFYINALKEFYRLLKDDGILIFKCQDKVSSSKQYFSHVFIMNEAEKLGYYCKDMFLLLAKQRIVANWQKENQKNARKYHSYFLVFEKSKRKIQYV
jgi:hypothetical protein